MKTAFDEIIEEKFNKICINYGIMRGSADVVLIKVGINGTIYGYDNKYLNMASNLNDLGYTVVVSSNPYDKAFLKHIFGKTNDYIKNAVDIIKNLGIKNPNILIFAHSNGALMCLEHSYKYPEVSKLLLVNMPVFRFNINQLNKCIACYDKIKFVYGSLDTSYKLSNRLKSDIICIQDANHHFSNDKLNDFICLPFNYLI